MITACTIVTMLHDPTMVIEGHHAISGATQRVAELKATDDKGLMNPDYAAGVAQRLHREGVLVTWSHYYTQEE